MITVEEVKSKTPERFWEKIKFGEPDECWEWQRCRRGSNWYGCFLHLNKEGIYRNIGAHRYLYIQLFGSITNKKLLVLHTCDNPICCNPNHLWLGTHRNNMDDKVLKDRQQKGSNVNTSKLTRDKVLLIRERLSVGDSQRKLAKFFGVKHTSIGQIGRRTSWKHLQAY